MSRKTHISAWVYNNDFDKEHLRQPVDQFFPLPHAHHPVPFPFVISSSYLSLTLPYSGSPIYPHSLPSPPLVLHFTFHCFFIRLYLLWPSPAYYLHSFLLHLTDLQINLSLPGSTHHLLALAPCFPHVLPAISLLLHQSEERSNVHSLKRCCLTYSVLPAVSLSFYLLFNNPTAADAFVHVSTHESDNNLRGCIARQ